MPRDETTPEEAPRASEVDGFRAVKRRRAWFWFSFLTWLPGASLAIWIHEIVGGVVATAWLLGVGVAGTIHGLSRCPRCGDACFVRTLWVNRWAARCQRCRTPLYWSEPELEDASRRAGAAEGDGSRITSGCS